jgi:predicted aspartyl protease
MSRLRASSLRKLGGVAAVASILLVFTGLVSTERREAAIEVPFELDRHVILVSVKISGQGPYLMMLDTGTYPSAIDLATARSLGLPLGTGGAIDGGGTEDTKAYETHLPSVKLGGLTATHVEALAGSMIGAIARKLGRPVIGVLGHSFLEGRTVQIDYPALTLRFLSTPVSHLESQPGRRAVIPFHEDEDVIIDDAWVNGQRVRADLDTGSNGTVKLTPEAIRKLGLDATAPGVKAGKAIGYRGTYSTQEGRIQSFRIGSITETDLPATFWTPGTGHDGKPWDVNVGNQFFESYVVTFDYKSKTVVIEKP